MNLVIEKMEANHYTSKSTNFGVSVKFKKVRLSIKSAAFIQATEDPTANLHEDLAAERKAIKNLDLTARARISSLHSEKAHGLQMLG